jgi:hypothetical protein
MNFHSVLSRKYHKDEVKIYFLSTTIFDYDPPYFLIKFIEYLPNEDRVKFWIYYRDSHDDVEVKKVGTWPFLKDECIKE